MYIIYNDTHTHTRAHARAHTHTHTHTKHAYCVRCNLKVQKEERSKEEHRGPSWREASQLIDTSAWFLNQVNSGPNQHL